MSTPSVACRQKRGSHNHMRLVPMAASQPARLVPMVAPQPACEYRVAAFEAKADVTDNASEA